MAGGGGDSRVTWVPGQGSSSPATPCLLADLLHPPLCGTAGKTFGQLAELEAGIQEQLDSGTAADPEYWQVSRRRQAGVKHCLQSV